MSKISTYEVAPVPKLSDKLIGTSVGGEIEDITYNFTLLELLELFLPVIPANNLQGILDYGNTATQDINLFGTITTTNLDVTETATLFNTYLVGDTHVQGGIFDIVDSIGTAGQVLTSTGEFVEWITLPPIFTPSLQQVLAIGNTSDIDIVLDANLESLDINTNTETVNNNLTLGGTITDGYASVGTPNQVLSTTVTGVQWVDLPVYSATSPLLFNSATGVFSIQQATSYQGGYLSANDWITFDGKQNAGNYITSLIGEATGVGPGAASVTLGNSAVIGKVLTGFNPIPGTINGTDTILTAFEKVQSQINALVGGVQYQGVWNASTNVPTLVSSVGVQGHYYIVDVAGSTNLNGITDWKVGDWAIFSESTWQKVDNTDAVSSVNGFTGAVNLTTDDIPEGATNLYYLDSRARAALSFTAGSGAYNSTTGVITIPTNTNQLTNGANYITLGSLSASSPLSYNVLTGAFSIQQATALVDGYLSAIDWSIFNNKQNYLGGTGLVKSVAGTISYITDNSTDWNTAYENMIVSAAVTGTSTKTLTLNQQDGGTITASWTDLDTGLTSVGVSMPTAFTVTNSPLTANGTIAITGAGTNLEYIDGTGALRTFPGLTGYVPYIGAVADVDLGTFGLIGDYFRLNVLPTSIPTTVGTMSWNDEYGTMDIKLKGGNVTLQVGQENVTRVVNKSGVDLLESNYQAVRVRKVAEGGAQGQRTAVVLALGNSENNSTEVLGLVTETILLNQEGFITSFGIVTDIDTTGALQGETWVDGDVLFVSPTVAGQLTKVRPVAPNHAVTIGYVTYAHANNGKITLAIDTGYELGELHNVYAPAPVNTSSIYWNSTTSRYENNTIEGILGYAPANDSLVVHLAGTETITGSKTFDAPAYFNKFAVFGSGYSLYNGTNLGTLAGPDYTGINAAKSGSITDLQIKHYSSYISSLRFSNDVGSFTYTFPDASGTVALVGDLTAYVPTSRTLTINGTTYDLTADRTWTITAGVSSVTASSPLFSTGGANPNITIQQANATQDGYLSSTDWTTFNSKQASGNYITSLTGEATATGPGAAAVTLNNASVTAKILTGVNITGGTIQATDTMLTAFGKLQNQINGLIGGSIYQGTWNASTNTPALASGVGTKGYYYIVSVAGTTNLDGITDWNLGDWAIFDGTAWQQVDNTDSVSSVNGFTGAVSLTTDNIPEGVTNLYFTPTRAQNAITLTTTGTSGVATYSGGTLNIPNYTTDLSGYVPTSRTLTINGVTYDLSANRTWTITAGISSVSGTTPISVSTVLGAATVSISQATTSTDGYLSSTDWNTFNNKVPTSRTLTINGVGYDLSADRSWTIDNTSASTRTIQKFTSTAGQTVFTITGGYTVGLVDVFVNGVKLDNATDFTATNGTTVVLTTALTVGQTVEVYKYGSQFIINNALRQSTTFTATAGQTTFVVNYAVGLLDVFYNGSKLDSSQYTATNGTSIVLGTACNLNDIVEVIAYNYTVGAFAGVSGTGTTNYVSKWTATGAIGNSLIYDNGTNVLIGTATSSSFASPKLAVYDGNYTVLEVRADTESRIALTTGITGSTPYTEIYNSYGNFAIKQNYTGGTTYPLYYEGASHYLFMQTNGVQAIRVFSNQNVLLGTGTTDAGYKLDVNGTARVTTTSTNTALMVTLPANANATILQTYSSNIGYGWKLQQDEVSTGDFRIFRREASVDYQVLNFARSTGAATFSSSVLATGITAKSTGNYGGFTADNSSSATIGGGFYAANSFGSLRGLFGVAGAISGSTDNNVGIFAEGGSGMGAIKFFVNGSGTASHMMASSGNLLIGTTTDNGSKLQVAGNSTFTNGRQILAVTGDSRNGILSTNGNPIESYYVYSGSVAAGATISMTINQILYEFMSSYIFDIVGLYAPSGVNVRSFLTGIAHFFSDGSTNDNNVASLTGTGWSVSSNSNNSGTFNIVFTNTSGSTMSNVNIRALKLNRMN